METSSVIQHAIALLNSHNSAILNVQKWMLMARIRRAARLGDVDAQRFVQRCELNVNEIAMLRNVPQQFVEEVKRLRIESHFNHLLN